MYSLNQYKFNNQILLPKLSNILNKIIGKKIEYNIINLKSIAYNTDLFTHALALKLKKTRMNHMKSMFSILNRAYLPKIGACASSLRLERTLVKGCFTSLRLQNNVDLFLDKYKDLKIISNMNFKAAQAAGALNLDGLLNDIHAATSNKDIGRVGCYNFGIREKSLGSVDIKEYGI